MAVPLKHVDLMLEEDVVERLEEGSRLQGMSLSEYVGDLLARDVGAAKPADPDVFEQIRRLREQIYEETGPMSDSTLLIRALREGEW